MKEQTFDDYINSKKLYVLVRQDLIPGYQIAQAIHVKDQFTHDFPEIETKWYNKSNTIVVLGVANQEELLYYAGRVKKLNLKSSIFVEPDIDEFTALAVEPSVKSADLFCNLKTAGKGYRLITK